MSRPKHKKPADGSGADAIADPEGPENSENPKKDEKTEGAPERLYVVTGGRSSQEEQAPVDLVTLVVARCEPGSGLLPERAAVLRMCQFPLSVAEISAYLVLPVSTVTVLLADLLEENLVQVRAPVPVASLPDPELLQAVMHGLQNL